MVEENTDETGQVVDDQGVDAQVTNEQGVEGQVAAGESQDEQQVPYTRFKEVNEQKNAAEEAKRLAEEQLQQSRDQIALMQVNQPQVTKVVSSYEQALKDCGLLGLENLSQEELIQVNARKDQIDAGTNQQNQQVIANQQFAQSHSDFVKAVGQVNPVTGQFMASAELQKILTEKPYLQASCLTAQGAYSVVMQERQLSKLTQEATALKGHQTQQNVDTKLSPMSSVAAGGGGVDRSKGKISESSTADDVLAMEARVKSGEFESN